MAEIILELKPLKIISDKPDKLPHFLRMFNTFSIEFSHALVKQRMNNNNPVEYS